MKKMENKDYLREKIRWSETSDVEFPFKAVHDGDKLLLRLNDFPAEPLYTLFVNGEEIMDLDDFSNNWKIKKEFAYNTAD